VRNDTVRSFEVKNFFGGRMGRQKEKIVAADTPALIGKKSNRSIFQEYSEAFVVAVVLAIIIRALFVQAFKIPSGSMQPTLLIGDHILVNKLIYGVRIPFTDKRWPHFDNCWPFNKICMFHQPARGDVIVFIFPEDRTKDFIKRVVGIAGDTIEIRNKQVIRNGKPATNPHARYVSNMVLPGDMSRRDNMPPVTVPPEHLFVMGDNRDESHDSRFWGFVPVQDVKGEAFLIYYSSHTDGWRRLFKVIR
jgi:signal peptidase I